MRSITRLLATAACSLSLFVTPALAQDAAGQPAADAQAGATKVVHPALWKVADEDTTIYLFGTIHLLPKTVNWYNGPVKTALEQSGELVTEVPMGAEQAAQGAMMKMGQRDDGKTLRESLPEATRTKYEALLTQMGLPPAAFDANDAWFAALVLSTLPLMSSGYDLSNGIDKQVSVRASALGMDLDAFETPEFQIGLFENLPAQVQANYLENVVESLPDLQSELARMITAWEEARPEELAAILNEDQSDPAIREALLSKRNANWTIWLKKRLEEPGTVFVAVGAGHLAGEDSVQALLAKDGISAKRVQ